MVIIPSLITMIIPLILLSFTLKGNVERPEINEKLGSIYTINLAIGLLSAIVDNVPLVAGAMGMYPTITPEIINALPVAEQAYAHFFVQDGQFWEFLAYIV